MELCRKEDRKPLSTANQKKTIQCGVDVDIVSGSATQPPRITASSEAKKMLTQSAEGVNDVNFM